MTTNKKPRVVVLGTNLTGLTVARFIAEYCEDAVDITAIDRKPYLVFVPNIPIEVFANRNPEERMHLHVPPILSKDGTEFIQADVTGIDLDRQVVTFTPSERLGAAMERIRYDYLVVALGARLAFDRIEGFGAFGHCTSDSYYGNKLRRYLHDGYRGGPIAIGSARFHQGHTGKPEWLPESKSACEGPPLEISMALASWLEDHRLGGPGKITLFTPAEVIAEDAGKQIVAEFLELAGNMGFGYKNNTKDVVRLTAGGIEFASGDSLEAEVKIIFPDWQPHPLLRDLPITDDVGFVATDLLMRTSYPNVFAAGDCAALTVPKLGAHGHQQAMIIARQLAKAVDKLPAGRPDTPFKPEIICMGEMGHRQAFYVHSDVWYGGDISVFKMGYLYYGMKLGFREIYYHTGGKPPSWGIPLTEVLAERLGR